MSLSRSALSTSRTLLRRSIAAPSSIRTFSSSQPTREHFLDASPEVFEKQISGSKVTLVDFYADWCGPCKVLTPILKAVVSPESGADLITINTDVEQDLAAKFKIAALPTVIAFKDGKVVTKMVGARNAAAVKQFLDEAQA